MTFDRGDGIRLRLVESGDAGAPQWVLLRNGFEKIGMASKYPRIAGE